MTRSDLPEDLVDEILCRVPATYLNRLRSTCQGWNRLYKDWRFARKHFNKAPKQFLSVMGRTNNRIFPMRISLTSQYCSSIIVPSVQLKGQLSLTDPKHPRSEFDIARVSHCDGLLLCTSKYETRIVVWNLLTGETKWIQGLKRNRIFVLGYCNNSNSYKILSCGLCSNDLEIYDFSSHSWRFIDNVISPVWSLSFSFQCVSVKGNAYMFATKVRNERKTDISLSLLEFDFSTEKSVTVPLPRQWHSHRSTCLSVVREEKIGVLLQHECTSKTEIWVSNKIDQGIKVVSWSNILTLYLSPDLLIWHNASFLLDEEKKLVMFCMQMKKDNGNTVFDTVYIVGEDSKVTQVDFGPHTKYGGWPTIRNYVPSLVRIDHAVYKRKRGD